jgi:PAS domain S-box-containing protein
VLLLTIGFLFALSGFFFWRIESRNILKLHLAHELDKSKVFQNYLTIINEPQRLLTYDYSYWDDMVAYVYSKDPAWSKENIDSALETFKVDAIWILDKDYQTISSVIKGMDDSPETMGIPSEVKASLSKNWFNHFFVFAPRGLLEINTAPIQPSSDNARATTPFGYLITGRLWDDSRLKAIAELTGCDLVLGQSTAPDAPIEITTDNLAEIRAGIAVFRIELQNSQKQSVAQLVVTSKNEIFRESFASSKKVLFLYVLFVLVIIVLVSISTMYLIYRPLQKVTESLKNEDPFLLNDLQNKPHEFGSLARLVIQSFKHHQELSKEIVKQKQAEEALRESEGRLQMLMDLSMDMISFQTEGVIRYMNRAGLEMHGATSKEQIVGRPVLDLFPPEDRESIRQDIERMIASGRPVQSGQARFLRLDGSRFEVELNMRPFLFRGVPAALINAQDVTSRRHAEKSLESSELRYRRLFEAARDGILILDEESGMIVDVNPFMVEMLGYTREEFFDKSIWDIGPLADVLRSKIKFEKLQDLEYVRYDNLPLKSKNGREHSVEFVSNVYEVAGKKVIQCNIRDITAQRKLEEQLRQSQKMEAVGRLAGGVAHDFNNMLTIILGHTGLLMMQLKPDDPSYASLNEILSAAERSADLTKQLLAFSRKQTAVPRVVKLDEIVLKGKKMLSRLIGEEINLKIVTTGDLWNIRIDPTQVDQILANLVVNARDAIQGNGTISIEMLNTVMDETMGSNALVAGPGDYVMLAVRDTGSGMDAATIEHIFEPFFTTKEEGRGTGLGLSTVFGIVKQNQGIIHVYSEPGSGTTFKIYFPRFITGVEETTEEVNVGLPTGSETILIVEDEKAVLNLVKMVVEESGYRVLSASDPGEALELAEQYQEVIHLLLTDIVMPTMNGRELNERMKALRPGIKTLFMSGYTSDIIADRGLVDEGVNFIHKPISRKVLARKVRELLDG